MRAPVAPTLWWQLTPVQRALLLRVAREGAVTRLSPWEGRTVRSLVDRDLLRKRLGAQAGPAAWSLTPRGRRLLPPPEPAALPQAVPET